MRNAFREVRKRNETDLNKKKLTNFSQATKISVANTRNMNDGHEIAENIIGCKPKLIDGFTFICDQ